MTGSLDTRRYRQLRARCLAECQASAVPCWLCAQPIDYTIPWRDPHTGQVNDDAFELDHLYPRSTHPELSEDYGNFRASHRSCNRERGNKMPRGGLGVPTRRWVLE